MRRRHLLGFLAAMPLPALAGDGGVNSPAWRPSRSIRLVVPVSAGGSQDAVARILARSMSEELGKAIVVENLPGAAGNLGFQTVARARPDGHTLLAGSDGLSINKHRYCPGAGTTIRPAGGAQSAAWDRW